MRALALVCAAAAVSAAPAADEITSLPGWTDALPTRMWSGFLSGGADVQDGVTYNKSMWYMAAECEAADKSACPLVLWSNGGPGASSAYGFFTELGVFTLSSESMSTSPPTLFRNPYSWTTIATVVILNGPAPVGYSFVSVQPKPLSAARRARRSLTCSLPLCTRSRAAVRAGGAGRQLLQLRLLE